MQRRLYLIRHAHAAPASDDASRRLSDKGRRQIARLCRGWKEDCPLIVDMVWQSGLVRARETAEALKEGLQLVAPIQERPGLTPYDDPANVPGRINEAGIDLAIVGHEPNLSLLASLLLAGDRSFERIVFAKASILCLSRLNVGSQATPWQIEWHTSHRLYR